MVKYHFYNFWHHNSRRPGMQACVSAFLVTSVISREWQRHGHMCVTVKATMTRYLAPGCVYVFCYYRRSIKMWRPLACCCCVWIHLRHLNDSVPLSQWHWVSAQWGHLDIWNLAHSWNPPSWRALRDRFFLFLAIGRFQRKWPLGPRHVRVFELISTLEYLPIKGPFG